MKKWLILLIIYPVIIYVFYQHREAILTWINEGDLTYLPMMFLLSAVISVFPVIPFVVFAGLMGAVYGVFWGAAINWFGSVAAAALYFILARYSFASYLRTYIKRYRKLDRFTDLVERNAFVAVLFARTLHIVPPPVTNIYSGISTMPITTYLLATGLGQIPGMLVYAFLGVHLFSSLHDALVGISIYIVFLLFVVTVYWLWSKRKAKISLN
jgi:uncharacterized membrane protein YdjX (TVP38/TMEM64 family)